MSNATSISEQALSNIDEIEQELEASSQYFKPKPGKTYVIKMDPQNDKIVPIENERFKDANGKPIKRYECKITHVNNGREQLWDIKNNLLANHRTATQRVYCIEGD
ncbi:MAG: hypothetical protein ACR2IS_10290 [Nitrososphaeraceae archaeon]